VSGAHAGLVTRVDGGNITQVGADVIVSPPRFGGYLMADAVVAGTA